MITHEPNKKRELLSKALFFIDLGTAALKLNGKAFQAVVNGTWMEFQFCIRFQADLFNFR